MNRSEAESDLPIPPDGLPFPRRYAAIAAISFGTALVVIDGAIASVALPTIAHDLHVENATAVLVITIYQLVLVMTLLPFSALGEQIGLKRLYTLGQVAFTLATFLFLFAKSLPLLLALRALQALGAAASLSVSSALLRDIYPSSQLGRGIGINSVVVSSASAIAPTLGGLILGVASWPWVFAAAVPFGLLSLLLGRALPDSIPHRRGFDFPGAALCALTLGLIISGFESAIHGIAPILAGAIIGAGIIVAILFVRRELKEPHPILPVDLLGNRIMALSLIGAFTGFLASTTLLLSLPFRLQHEFGFAPSTVGAMLAPWPLTIMFVAPLAGSLSDRIRPGLLGAVGMGLAMVAMLFLAFLPAHPSYLDVAWPMALGGGGFGLFLPPNSRLIISSAPRDRAAAVGGLISTNRLVGQTLGATLVAALLAINFHQGKGAAFVAVGLALIAGICSIARSPILSPKTALSRSG